MREAVYESEELESEWEEDYAVLSLEHVGSLEAKWEDLEVASVCSSTTAGFGTTSTASDFGWEFLEPTTPSCPSAPKIDISPWQAALRRAERGAKEYVAEVVNLPEGKKSAEKKEASQRHLSQKAALSNEVKFLDDLGRLHRARVGFDSASLKDTTSSFEKLRWGFLKDFGDSICSNLSSCYNGVWDLRPAPIDKDVQRMFMDAQQTSKKPDALQPALHGTNQSNLGSIYSRGLLIPGNHNGLRVVNGSAYGLGIYTAYVQNASMSMNYSRGPLRPVLVCGVIDEKSGATQPMGRSGDVYYTSHARIFYKEELVAPLFEATFSGKHATAGAVPLPRVCSRSRRSALLRARALELAEDRRKPKKGLKGPQTRLKLRLRPASTVLSSAQAFLARRKTSTLKSLCNEAFDASEASTHGVAGAVCTTERRFETTSPRRGSSEWRRMRRFPTSDFDTVVARHVAAALRRDNSPEDAEPDAEARATTPERTRPRPAGWSSVPSQDGEHRSFKMPVDLVIKHMRSDDGTEDDSITLQTFDFAGQEEYHMLHHLFLSNKGLYLVVFDLSLWADESGDDRTSEEALTFWICSVHCHAPESRMLLVGTHVDMLGAHKMAILEKVDRRIHELLERNQALNEQLVVNTAEELCFFPIDNRRRGRQSVESLRVKIDETAAEICTTGFLSKALPLYWLRYQTELIRLARAGPDRFWGTASVEGTMPAAGASSSGPPKPVHALPFSQVSRLGRAVGIHDEGELLSVLIYLHDTGSIIFFDEEKLRDCVVLDPYWLAEAAANIFNCPRVVQGRSASARRLLERGELHVDLLREHLWRSERFVDHIPVLINLMLRFDLLVSSSDQDVFVVPFLLPFKTGGYEPPGEGSLSFDFHGMLTRLLPTVFPRLIASAAKMPSLRLTHSRVYKDSCTIFLGTRRLAFELLPPGRPEMIAVKRLAGSEDGAESDGDESGGLQLPLDLAKQVISLVHESTSEWLPHLSFTAGVLCPHCHRSGAPHVIDVSELSEVVICSRTHEPVTLAKAGWAFRWRQEVLTSGGASRKSSDVVLDVDVEEELQPTAEEADPEHPEPPEPPAKLARPPSLPGVERRTVPIPIVTSSEALPAPSPSSPHPGEETPVSPSMPDQVGLLYFLYASPLTVDTIDVRAELQLLREALRAGQTTGGDQNEFKFDFKVELDIRLGLSSTLLELLAHGDSAWPNSPVFLHCAMHAGYAANGQSLEPFLLLEDEVGCSQPLPRWRLLQWLRQSQDQGRKSPLSAVFLNCCDSEGIAGAFMEAGVPHVICCRGRVFDGACKTFTKAFYRALAAGRQVFSAYEYARESVATAPQAGLRAEAPKFLLLPRQEDVLRYPGLSVAPMARHYGATLQLLTARVLDGRQLGNAASALQWMGAGGSETSKSVLPGRHQHFLGRAQEMVEMARHLSRGGDRHARVVNVWGKAPGLGKTAMLAEFTRFCNYPGRLFEGASIWVTLTLESPTETLSGPLSLERASSSGSNSERGHLFLEQVAQAVTNFMEQVYGRKSHFENLREGLLWALRRLDIQGRTLLVLDGIEDWVDSSAVRGLLADMLQATERLCLLFGSRIHVQNSFAGLKTDNLELRPLQARDAAQLFLFRVHRHLYWKDIWKNKEEWMSKAKNWYGDAVYSKVADRSQLETGEVPIALQRENRDEVLDALAAMPLLSEFCQGIPLRIQQTAERVTATLPCLWDLHAQLRSERDRGRAEIQQRLLAKKATMRPGARQIGSAWQLGKVIGQGAHGVVYHALDSASGESFAVKVVEESKELHQELEMLQSLEHEHIVSYLGHEIHDRQLYIFLEYMPEGTLKDKIEEFGAFQEDLCAALGEQVLKGLEYLHGQQVLHRDLKCSNLLLDVSGRVKISDFGCSRWIAKEVLAMSLVGSPFWLPPELLIGAPYDQSADIWSFGCSVIELLTALRPWATQVTADNPLAAAHQIRVLTEKGERPSLPESSMYISEPCRDFLYTACLRCTATERLTAKDLLQHPWLRRK
ncbi:unnamed protein product [Symbiodinium sp. CCMP2592]|nr:unnamed protein product [Symbiodinium sp. CCMP2592]